MAISVLQRTAQGDAAAAASIAKAFGSNLSAGSASIVIGTTNGAVSSLGPVTGSQGILYNQVASITANAIVMKAWIAYNMSAAAETVTIGTNFNDANVFLFEVSGLASYSAFDKVASAGQSSATALDSGTTFSLLSPNSVCIGITSNTPTPGLAPTVGATYGNLQTLTTAFNGGGSEEKVVAGSTGVNATFGLAANAANEFTAVFVFGDRSNGQLVLNNYKFVSVGDGMSATEKIR